MAGYANRLITIMFDEWTDDPENDPLWASIRNPKLVPPGELQPREVPLDENGQPRDTQAATLAMYEILAKLIVAWRLYDATVLEIDDATGEPVDQPLLPLPATPDRIAKLPTDIVTKLVETMTGAATPS